MIEAIAVLIGALTVGFTGFGFNVISVPILALVLPAREAVIVALIVGTIVNGVIAFRSKVISWRVLTSVLLGSLPGTLIGAALFGKVSDTQLKITIGVLTAIFAGQMLWRRSQAQLPTTLAPLATLGVVSGTLTALSGMGGPPLVIYLAQALRRSETIRATIAAHSMIASIAALSMIAVSGHLVAEALKSGLVLIIPAMVGLAIGSALFSVAKSWYRVALASALLIVAALAITSATLGIESP